MYNIGVKEYDMSKWDKLLEKILNLSKDMRFDELRRILEAMGIRCILPEAEVATTLFGNPVVSP